MSKAIEHTVEIGASPRKIKMTEMKVGQVARIANNDLYDGTIIARVYDGGTYDGRNEMRWFGLNRPQSTWSGSPSIEVELLPPGTVITLTVGA
jgi:hypothetical protein